MSLESSNNPAIQLSAFIRIITFTVSFPSLRDIAEMVCQKRGDHIDIVTFSWNRPSATYSSSWLYHYNLASHCLSMHSSSVTNVLANSQTIEKSTDGGDFFHVANILACCR